LLELARHSAADAHRLNQAIASVDLGRPQFAGLRILVVDDDTETRELLSRSLSDLGATVVRASSAAEARVEISRRRSDAIASDIGMPDEDGLAFVRSLKKRAEGTPIPAIALAAYASTKNRGEALEAGYCEHVAKPVAPYQPTRVIVAALRQPSGKTRPTPADGTATCTSRLRSRRGDRQLEGAARPPSLR
jgi:CheY-like chemotaxis protein